MLAERIKALRENRGLSQEELGISVGVTKQTVSNWENDNITPSMDKFIRLLEFFHATPNYLLGYEDEYMLDMSGLSQEEAMHIQMLVSDMKNLHRKAEETK